VFVQVQGGLQARAISTIRLTNNSDGIDEEAPRSVSVETTHRKHKGKRYNYKQKTEVEESIRTLAGR
jgi:hypothetical protein